MSHANFIYELNSNQTDTLVALYQNEFWCHTRTRPDVDKMLKNTDIVIGAIDENSKLIGFVCILTDFVYKATIYDLIVHPHWRNQKLGQQLMEAVMNHPKLHGVEHFDLHCLPEMIPFYEKWGFTAELGELGFMRRFQPA
ncbi:MAG: GNAT family N-acetyltransferase [Gammaproteobacteria bacterium]|nr:GNAT family N-acetyltransferase [Gammaproteobacteria bacterium]